MATVLPGDVLLRMFFAHLIASRTSVQTQPLGSDRVEWQVANVESCNSDLINIFFLQTVCHFQPTAFKQTKSKDTMTSTSHPLPWQLDILKTSDEKWIEVWLSGGSGDLDSGKCLRKFSLRKVGVQNNGNTNQTFQRQVPPLFTTALPTTAECDHHYPNTLQVELVQLHFKLHHLGFLSTLWFCSKQRILYFTEAGCSQSELVIHSELRLLLNFEQVLS